MGTARAALPRLGLSRTADIARMAADGDDGNLGGQVLCDGGLKSVALGKKEAVEVGPGVVTWLAHHLVGSRASCRTRKASLPRDFESCNS